MDPARADGGVSFCSAIRTVTVARSSFSAAEIAESLATALALDLAGSAARASGTVPMTVTSKIAIFALQNKQQRERTADIGVVVSRSRNGLALTNATATSDLYQSSIAR